VDEACPPASLLRLALLNREAGLPLTFWGNVRFEKTFTTDAAAILAAGGLIGVSAGIEIAAEKGMARLDKGFDPQDAVNACAAFKEAGILVHAYCIYGYWDQDEQEIADSAETLRQFFAAGLLDSAFWHQFVLTKHSRLYAEKTDGMHQRLKPRGDPLSLPAAGKRPEKIFALNDLSFAGEERFDRFAAPLNRLLGQWMRGNTAYPVHLPLAAPSVASNLIETMLNNYARSRDKDRRAAASPTQNVIFLASKPFAHYTAAGAELRWRWHFKDCVLKLRPEQAKKTVPLLETAACGNGIGEAEFFSRLESIFADDTKRVWNNLRRNGLAIW
jgi:hypothetical protein